MPPLTVKDISVQVDALMAEYVALGNRSHYPDLSDLHSESAAFVVRLRAAIERLAPEPTAYYEEMRVIADDHKNSIGSKIEAYLGILGALKADANNGWTQGVAELLHANTFSDFLDQAQELVDKSYKDAAAVIAGSALEAHIRLLCVKFGVSTSQTSGQPKKADTMNADLVKAGAYHTMQQKAVTAWLGLRNEAAHGNYSQYTNQQVALLIDGIRNFIIQHPA